MSLPVLKYVKYRVKNKSPLTQSNMQVRHGNTEFSIKKTLTEKHYDCDVEDIDLIEVIWK